MKIIPAASGESKVLNCYRVSGRHLISEVSVNVENVECIMCLKY